MVMEYVNSIKVAWELAKAVKASTDALDDAQMKLQVAELIGALADARIQAAESAELISTLEKQLKTKETMDFNGSVYYRTKDDGKQEGPWCPTCFDARSLEIRLQLQEEDSFGYHWHCKECDGWFK